ncbi:hypothetical protein COK25_09980 [Bacillus cereus]|uniref:Uncharacterized protein n=1 Tax=Bacillus thuringiensis TaxID=1428 RepID=A0AB36TME3_BACTU|nr:hypothetical protein CON66_23045 [Bacillus cereus]PEF10101.1 hypothetical protein CON23_23550 [Bacillus thuringiensis]PED38577.1 hypothetical protein CON24_08375 [Bacillus cereus]PEF50164.1 hypothetical protein CON56_23200 [Bacillus thuringiensis]PEG01723.1 hypothetical protein CON54_27645 [Bacillus cereus]
MKSFLEKAKELLEKIPSKFLLYSTAGAYALTTILVYVYWCNEKLYLNADGIKEIQDFVKTLVSTNLSVSLGVAALNTKVFEHDDSIKKEFLGTLNALIMFIFMNFIFFSLSYQKVLISKMIFDAIILFGSAVSLIWLMKYVFTLCSKTIREIK